MAKGAPVGILNTRASWSWLRHAQQGFDRLNGAPEEVDPPGASGADLAGP